MSPALFTRTITAALGAGAIAGVFYAFSSFVMSALKALPAPHGIAAMQSINVTAVRPAFMAGLFGTAALCVALAVVAVVTWGDRRAALLLAGSLLYLVGTILLTIGFHVPRNNALASLDPLSAGAAAHWAGYLKGWTAGNHVRAAAALGAAVAFTLALTL